MHAHSRLLCDNDSLSVSLSACVCLSVSLCVRLSLCLSRTAAGLRQHFDSQDNNSSLCCYVSVVGSRVVCRMCKFFFYKNDYNDIDLCFIVAQMNAGNARVFSPV